MKVTEVFAGRKRILCSTAEKSASEKRAIAALERAGFRAGQSDIEPLVLSDCSETYRVTGPTGAAVLKMMPPPVCAISARVQRFLELRGIELPAILWSDFQLGAIVYEDAGNSSCPASSDEAELFAIARYLAKLHAACRIPREQAAMQFPDLAAGGVPLACELAAQIVHNSTGLQRSLRRQVVDAACVLADWIEREECVLIVSDIKREHFRFRDGRPVLLDLEFCSFADVPPANLATLLGFPGQFWPPLSDALKERVLIHYAAAVRELTGKAIDLDRLRRSVAAAECLLSLRLTREGAPAGGMIRERPLRVSASSGFSVESELGRACFEMLTSRLQRPDCLRVADLGCGEGIALAHMRESWPQHHCFGLDLMPGSEARPCVLADAKLLPFPDLSLDIALAVQLLQYVRDKLAFLAEVYRALKPGGLAVFAMTEHFLPQSGFDPPLSLVMESSHPPEAFQCYAQRRVGRRLVTSFALIRVSDDLQFRWTYTGAKPFQMNGDTLPYLQSQYQPRPSSD
jgi:ubiquinone/menaquinone biosynthesis C-methylase UbiE